MSVQVFQQPARPAPSLMAGLSVTIGAPSLADLIVDRHRTALGLNLAGVAADIGAVNQQNAGLGAEIGRLVDAQLTPVERGQLLSGRFHQDLPSPFVPPVLGAQPAPQAHRESRAGPHICAADIFAIESPSEAPASLNLPVDLAARCEVLRQRSVPGGISRSQGGTIVTNPAGALMLINEGGLGATSASFTPDLKPDNPGRQQIRGTFLTLPFDGAEGAYTSMSIGGGGAAYLINSGQMMLLAQSGPRQFALVRTRMSPDSVNASQVLDAHEASLIRFAGAGHGLPKASRLAIAETARSLSLAYYEGSGGALTRR